MKRPIYNFFTTWSTGVAALLLAGLISPSLLYAQDSYEENRNRLLNQQSSTRSQIENIDRQIETISRRLSERSTEFNEVFAQFEEVERLVNLQEERLRQLNREQGNLAEEIRLIEQNVAELQQELDDLIERYREANSYYYKNYRITELALQLISVSFK